MIDRCEEAGVKTVLDVLDLEDEARNQLLQMTPSQLGQVARFANAFPSINVEHEVVDPSSLNASTPIEVKVALEREVDEDEEVEPIVNAQFYPYKKTEANWVVIGEPSSKTLLAIKRINLVRSHNLTLSFQLPAGHHQLQLSLISDSYVGSDLAFDLSVNVAPGEPSDDEDEDAMDEDDD